MTNNTHQNKHLQTTGLCLTLFAGLCPTLHAAELKFSLAADAENYELGSGFAATGDLNADGIVDLAIADRSGQVNSLTGSGVVHIVSGADGSAIRNYDGVPSASQNFGASLVALNADGDGIPDLAVGSPGQTGGGVRVYAGADGSLLSSAVGAVGSQLGSSLANAGDQNGDGIDDLFVGAPGANSSRGMVFVLSGSNGAILRQITTTASTSSFGVTLAALGDMDGDGLKDLAVGAPGFRVTGNQAGRVQLIRSTDGMIAFETLGAGVYNRLGESLAAVADANGDNLPDLLVGSYNGGTVRLVSGADLSTLKDLSIPSLPAYQQAMVGGSLDFDHDGTADWLIGSPGMQVVNSQPVGGIRVVSGLDQTTLFEFTANAPYSGLGLVIQALPGLGFAAGETAVRDAVTQGYGLAHVWGTELVKPVPDTDGDGVLDDVDIMPNSVMGATVVILGVDSKVENRVNSKGVTLADRFAALGDLSDYRVRALYYVKALHLSTKLAREKLVDKREARKLAAAALEGIQRDKREHRKDKDEKDDKNHKTDKNGRH